MLDRMRAGRAALFAALVPLTVGAAQEPGRGLIRGAVLGAESGERIPFAVVVLQPGFSQRFTDSAGVFVFTGLVPGTYHLQVRQVGYRPFDSTVTAAEVAVGLRVLLERIAVALPPVVVAATASCTEPGPPDPERQPALAALFDQLSENAARYGLLADQYPFRYGMTRRISVERDSGTSSLIVSDTLEIRSDDRWRYRPGRVVAWGTYGRMQRTKVVHLPELPDLADSTFQATHCFRYAGIDTLAERAYARLDFRAADRLRQSDVDGTAWLDTASYQLRQLAVRLTRPRESLADVESLSATVVFREVLPSIIVAERVTGLTTWTAGAARGLVGQIEEQRLVNVEFRRQPGTGQ